MKVLLRTWRTWAEAAGKASANQSLAADRPVLDALSGRRAVVRWSSWTECSRQFDPWDENCPLHTGLVPLPFVGDVTRAKVYFLLLNPGLSATDYYAEYECSNFRQRLLTNLKQDFRRTDYPFFPLDPDCSWHSGNAFWQGKLKHILLQLSERSGRTHAQVREFLAHNICAIEMLPYHSVRLDIQPHVLQQFESVKLARACVSELVAQAQAGRCLLVAMRKVDAWGIPLDCQHVLRFSGGQARGAHLSTKSDDAAGSRVVDFLLQHLVPRPGAD